MGAPANKTSRIAGFLARFSSKQLLFVVGGLFLLDVLTFDPIPFIDEAVLGILTLLIGRWELRRTVAPKPTTGPARKPPPKNVTPS